jgi:putative nucleotidyltransferase with HDIG domain
MRLLGDEGTPEHELAAAIESDAALTLAVLRAAVRTSKPVASIPRAVDALSSDELSAAIAPLRVFDFFERWRPQGQDAEGFRVHALATQRAADAIRRALEAEGRDELMVAALLHDVGKLVLAEAYDRYPAILGQPGTPEERLKMERYELGIDHAAAGALLVRAMKLPVSLAEAIERHHAEDAVDHAAVLRLADMIAHYSSGHPIDPRALDHAATTVGLDAAAIRSLLASGTHVDVRSRPSEPCPLSGRQREMLSLLADGKVYKEIAEELDVTASTVRSHLHLAYQRLGVADRAQAVLRASEMGWLR